jgi:hypothetical protein
MDSSQVLMSKSLPLSKTADFVSTVFWMVIGGVNNGDNDDYNDDNDNGNDNNDNNDQW